MAICGGDGGRGGKYGRKQILLFSSTSASLDVCTVHVLTYSCLRLKFKKGESKKNTLQSV